MQRGRLEAVMLEQRMHKLDGARPNAVKPDGLEAERK